MGLRHPRYPQQNFDPRHPCYLRYPSYPRYLSDSLNLRQNVSTEWGSFLYYKAGSQLLQNEVSADYKLG